MRKVLKTILMIDRFSYFENIMKFKKKQNQSIPVDDKKKKEDQIKNTK